MNWDLVVAIAIPVAGGLAFIAYRGPIGFRRIYWLLAGAVLLSSGSMALWNLAVAYTVLAIAEAREPLRFSHHFTWMSTVAILYLILLLWLPVILEDDEKK